MGIKDRLKNKQHWFCFTYANSGGRACAYTGYSQRNVTMAMIEENRINARAEAGAVLLACIYLGEMTKEEFMG